jgi:hypothetical protein
VITFGQVNSDNNNQMVTLTTDNFYVDFDLITFFITWEKYNQLYSHLSVEVVLKTNVNYI